MANLNTLFVGKVLQRFRSLDSTNDQAREWISKSTPIEGSVISASYQTAGKGQIGSNWESEADSNLLLSIILNPRFLPPSRTFDLNIMLSLAARDWASNWLEQEVQVKWPNDILVENQKLAGLLIQNSIQSGKIQYAILGMGINVNQKSFHPYTPPACSFHSLSGRLFDLKILENTLFQSVEQRYLQLKAGMISSLREEYLKHLWMYETENTFKRSDGTLFNGKIEGISAIGKLLIRHEKGVEVFGMKEVKVVLDA